MTRTPAYVVDASVALKWYFEEDDRPRALALFSEAARDRCVLYAPAFLVIEVANAVWKRHQRGEISLEAGLEIVAANAAIKLEWVEDAELVPRAAELAMTFGCTVYDALYLAVAEAYEAVVVTADRRLCEKVPEEERKERVRLLEEFAG